MSLRRSATAVIERDTLWEEEVATEPWEVGWATEAIFFIRVLERDTPTAGASLRVQVSPDGMHWVDEGTTLTDDGEQLMWRRVSHFGGWLRLVGDMPTGQRLRVIAYLSLKE